MKWLLPFQSQTYQAGTSQLSSIILKKFTLGPIRREGRNGAIAWLSGQPSKYKRLNFLVPVEKKARLYL